MRHIYAILASLAVAAGFAVSLTFIAGAAPQSTGTAVGQTAPMFSLQDQDGKNVDLSTYAGKVVVLEWTNPDCPFVQWAYQHHIMLNLSSQYQMKGVSWIAINSGNDTTNAINKKWATEQGIAYPILNDASGTVGHAYGATNTPGMFIIGKDGKLKYKGAIDSDPEQGDGPKINYVAQALTEVLANKPVTVPETKQYGCSVKYAN